MIVNKVFISKSLTKYAVYFDNEKDALIAISDLSQRNNDINEIESSLQNSKEASRLDSFNNLMLNCVVDAHNSFCEKHGILTIKEKFSRSMFKTVLHNASRVKSVQLDHNGNEWRRGHLKISMRAILFDYFTHELNNILYSNKSTKKDVKTVSEIIKDVRFYLRR